MRPIENEVYGTDPNANPSPPAFEKNAVGRFFTLLKEISFRPTRFFETLSPQGGISAALTFAIIVGWLSAAIGYFWTQVFPDTGESLQALLLNSGIFGDGQNRPAFRLLTNWNIGVGAVILTPFLKMIEILLKSGCIYLGAALFSSTTEKTSGRISFESTVRTVSYGHAPLFWMSLVPIAGGWFSSIWQMIVTIIGLREVFQVSGGKALLYFSFPAILFLLFIAGALLLAGAAVFGLITALMGQF